MKNFSQLMSHPTNVLYQLHQHGQFIQQLQQVLQGDLPAPLNQHCYIANLRDKILVIHTDSALWATRLRYLVPDLLTQWQRDSKIPPFEKIVVKVRPQR